MMPTDTSDTHLLKRPFGTLVLETDITKQKIVSMLEGAKITGFIMLATFVAFLDK